MLKYVFSASRAGMWVLVTFLFILSLTSTMMSQTAATGALTGTVRDPQGAVVPNATITLTSAATGQVRTVMTDADGSYKFSLLSPGAYRVRFEAPGFKTVDVPSIAVDVTETETLNRALEVGAQTQEVTVQAETEAIQTASSTVGTVISSRTVTDLPLSTRNFTNLISLSAGAAAGVNNATVLGQGNQNIAVNGSTTAQNNYQQDGVSSNMYAGTNNLNEGGNTGLPPIPNPDSIEQFKIQTSSYDASYGRNSGANVNVVTKSGTNAFHGTGFEFFRNTALNANDWFLKRTQSVRGLPNKQAALNQNQFGGTFGGPVLKDKLFFFVSYQQTIQKNGFASQGNANGLGFAPLPAGNRGTCPTGVSTIAQMQSLCDAATQSFVSALGSSICPISNGGTNTNALSKPFRNTYSTDGKTRLTGVDVNCSGNNINPQAIQILQLKLPNGSYYVPGSGTSNYLTNINITDPATYHEYQGSGNWDYLINPKHTLSGRYFFLTNPQIAPFAPAITSAFLPGEPTNAEWGNQLAILKLTSIVSNSLVNEARVSYKRNTANLQIPLNYTAPQVGITGVNPGGPYDVLPSIAIVGMFSVGLNYQQFQSIAENQPSFSDQISWTKGKHTFRTGLEYSHVHYKWLQQSYQFGAFQFQTFADFLLGLPGCTTTDTTLPAGQACAAGKAIAVAGGAGVLPASYSPLGTATNGTTFSNVDSIGAFTNRTDPGGLLHYFTSGNMSAFVQDDFKISPRLTLNVGLRWEYDQYVADQKGDGVNIWSSLVSLQPVPGSGCVFRGVTFGLGATGSGCSFSGYVAPSNYNVALRGALPAGVYLNSREDPTYSGPSKNNFAPRFGFAWQPFQTNRFAVRGGVGYFYDLIPGGQLAPPINQEPPYNNSINLSGASNFNSSFAQPFQPGPLSWTPRWVNFANGTGSNYNPAGTQGPIDPKLVTPLTYNYNLQVQYEFLPSWVLELGYVGSHGIHQEIPTPINASLLASAANPINGVIANGASGATGPATRAPLLGFAPSFHTASSVGGTRFNSMQATVRKNFSHGFTFQGAYTWASSFATAFVGNSEASLSNNVPVVARYALNSNYRPQRFIMNYSYQLPFGHHTGFMDKIAGGWTVSGVTTFQDGTPLTVTDSRMGTVFGSPGAPVVAPAQYAPGMGPGNVGLSGSIQDRIAAGSYLNAAAFCNPTVASCGVPTPGGGTALGYGNAGFGIVRGPAQNNFDMTLAKLTKVGGLREDASLEFRAEFFNLFNHPQFSNPVTTGINQLQTVVFGAATFGQINTTSVNPRFVQFGLKYRF